MCVLVRMGRMCVLVRMRRRMSEALGSTPCLLYLLTLTASLRGPVLSTLRGARLAGLLLLEGPGGMEGSPTGSRVREARAWGRVYSAPAA